MKIAFDSRYIGKSGIGRVNEGILDSLLSHPREGIEWLLLGPSDKLNKYSKVGQIIHDETSPFSKEGLFLSKESRRQINGCDAFLSVGYIVPFGIKIPLFLFIHDCVFFDLPETTEGVIDRFIKRYFYKRALKHSRIIFTVSVFSKERITSIFKTKADKIVVAYNGVSDAVMSFPHAQEKNNRFIFIGNFKRHKGIDVLLTAYKSYKELGGTNGLTIVGSKDKLRAIYEFDQDDASIPDISFLENVGDEVLLSSLASSVALIQPSRYEGFGLPPLEALCLGTNVLLSDIPVFKEVYDGLPVEFFQAGNPESLKEKMLAFQPKELSDFAIPNKFSFETMTDTIVETIVHEKPI